jgi:hypothetical protein
MELVAVRMADGIEPREAVEGDRIDDECVALPAAHGVTEPGRGEVVALRMLATVTVHDVEPSVLLEKQREVPAVLHDLHRLGGIEGSAQAEEKAAARVVAGTVGIVERVDVIGLPGLQPFRRIGKLAELT